MRSTSLQDRSDALKKKAAALFWPKLAKQVKEQIEVARARKPPKKASAGSLKPVATAQSLATAWLGDALYDSLKPGKFEGRIQLIWNGMDSFIYLPDPQHPFAYTTAGGNRIQPKIMETDGGSIPRAIRNLTKFSSWGYAPAFIIHDWLFVAHKCGNAPDDTWQFDQTAYIMAEAIKTLMDTGFTDYDGATQILEKAEDTLYLMYQGVFSSIANDLFEDKTTVRCMV